MKPFPAIVLATFGLLAAVSVVFLATFTSRSNQDIGTVTIWGPVPSSVMEEVFRTIRGTRQDFDKVSYRPVGINELVPQMVEAIAAGTGPDLVMFPAEDLLKESNKLQTIPYTSFPKRDFQDTFVQAGEIFLYADGAKALPFIIDPTVMYWNRTLFSNAGVAQPPRYWDEIPTLVPRITKTDAQGTLKQSAVALGSWSNIDHAKEIFLSLLKGLGNPAVGMNGSSYVATLESAGEGKANSAASVVRYFAQFSDPVKPVYSWNRSQASSRNAFLGGTLAIYFGPASELLALRNANPNLNFDVAELPRVRGGQIGAAAYQLGLSIPNGSKNPAGALYVANELISAPVQKVIGVQMHLPSVRRDTALASASDAFQAVFRDASLTAFTFMDPDPSGSDGIFQRMIEGVLSGKFREEESVHAANQELSALLGVRSQ